MSVGFLPVRVACSEGVRLLQGRSLAGSAGPRPPGPRPAVPVRDGPDCFHAWVSTHIPGPFFIFDARLSWRPSRPPRPGSVCGSTDPSVSSRGTTTFLVHCQGGTPTPVPRHRTLLWGPGERGRLLGAMPRPAPDRKPRNVHSSQRERFLRLGPPGLLLYLWGGKL